MARANIKVPRELFEKLRADKGGKTWETYLREHCLEAQSRDLDELYRRLDSLPKETAAELERRLR